jgi:hypothetical protein
MLTDFLLTGMVAGATVALLSTIGLWYAFTTIKRRIDRAIVGFVSQPDKDHPSPLAVWFDQAASILSARLILQAKTTLMGMASVDAKAESKAEASALKSAQPGLATILSLLPGSKRLMRNPALMSLAAGLMDKVGAVGAPAAAPRNGNGNGITSPFKL